MNLEMPAKGYYDQKTSHYKEDAIQKPIEEKNRKRHIKCSSRPRWKPMDPEIVEKKCGRSSHPRRHSPPSQKMPQHLIEFQLCFILSLG